MSKIQDITVTTGRKIVEAERKRLLGAMKEQGGWWESPARSDWARERFGPTLTEKDGFTHGNGEAFDGHRCNVCGVAPKSKDEPMIYMEFSFCEEYDCEMLICGKCIKKMSTLLAPQ